MAANALVCLCVVGVTKLRSNFFLFFLPPSFFNAISKQTFQSVQTPLKVPQRSCNPVRPNKLTRNLSNKNKLKQSEFKIDCSCSLLCLIVGRLRPISMPAERNWVGDYEEHGKLNRECHRGKRPRV